MLLSIAGSVDLLSVYTYVVLTHDSIAIPAIWDILSWMLLQLCCSSCQVIPLLTSSRFFCPYKNQSPLLLLPLPLVRQRRRGGGGGDCDGISRCHICRSGESREKGVKISYLIPHHSSNPYWLTPDKDWCGGIGVRGKVYPSLTFNSSNPTSSIGRLLLTMLLCFVILQLFNLRN